jgi:adenylate cyclase class 2
MRKRNSNQEIEIKLRVDDVAALRTRLKRLGARKSRPRTYESNTIYDTPEKDLTAHGQLIRIRVESPNSHVARKDLVSNSKFTLTYKGPHRSLRGAQNTPASLGKPVRYKIREEIEVGIADAEQMRLILTGLGLRPLFRYEKFRTSYALPTVQRLKIEFDETPIGKFLELEGTPRSIDRAAKLLGYTPADYITKTYGTLYVASCRLHGQKPAAMLFTSTKMLR